MKKNFTFGFIATILIFTLITTYATSDRPPKDAADAVEIALENSLECIKED